MSKILVLHYQDLRLHDNPALYQAAKESEVVPVYVLDDETAAGFKLGGAQRWWLHHALSQLAQSYEKHGVKLILAKGRVTSVVKKFVKDFGISAVYCNKTYEPNFAREYEVLAEGLKSLGLKFQVFHSYLLFEQEGVANKSGGYFKVFTPFWRHCLANLEQPRKPLPIPTLARNTVQYTSDDINAWKLLPTQPDWSKGIRARWDVSENAALERLDEFVSQKLEGYADRRDYPARNACSNLSPYLHFGMVGPNLVWHEALNSGFNCDRFLAELGWREFSYHLLHHFPELTELPFKKTFEKFPWQYNEQQLQAWKSGRTGIPIIDAGMRELWETGFMHNRVRMLVASFLTKNLLMHWKEGERWFWDTLVDADVANNAASWQWVAGSGADAAPYFRIFNPTLQAEKFDPQGEYIKKYIPELAHLSSNIIHKPWLTNAQYPKPIIDIDYSRKLALELYKQL